jgi:lysophospholipase L1-like esterase
MPKNKVKILQNLVLSITAIFLCLLIGESIVRNCYNFDEVTRLHCKGSIMEGDQSYFNISEDPGLLYELKNPPFKQDPTKKAGTFRIIILGDSTTYLFPRRRSMENYYPKMLEDILNSGSNCQRYEVINAGVIGYNMIQYVEYLKKRLLRYSPDLVIVGYCAFNDRTVKRKLINYKSGLYCSDVIESFPYVLSLPFNKYLLSKSALYRFINIRLASMAKIHNIDFLNKKIKYFDLTFDTENAIKELKDLSLKNRFDLLFAIIPLIDKNRNCHYECEWIVKKCKEFNIKFVDLRSVLYRHSPEELAVFKDDIIHFNRLGNQLIAQEIYDYLRNEPIQKTCR